MILDAFLEFDPALTSVAIAAGTQASTNVIDLGIGTSATNQGIPSFANGGGARDIGIGDRPAMKLLVQVDTAFASAGSTGSIQVAIQGAPDNGSGVPGTYVTMVTGPLYVIPALGAQLLNIDMPRPKDGNLPRFLRLLYTVATQTMTAGTVNAHLVIDREDQPNIAAGYLGGYQAGINVAN